MIARITNNNHNKQKLNTYLFAIHQGKVGKRRVGSIVIVDLDLEARIGVSKPVDLHLPLQFSYRYRAAVKRVELDIYPRNVLEEMGARFLVEFDGHGAMMKRVV